VSKQLPRVFSSAIASSTRSTSTICGNTGRKAPHVTRKHVYLRTSLNFLVIVVISVRPASLRRHTDRDVGHRRRPSGDCPSRKGGEARVVAMCVLQIALLCVAQGCGKCRHAIPVAYCGTRVNLRPQSFAANYRDTL
jgi:hypothetical protein